MNKQKEIENVIEKAYCARLSFLPKKFRDYVETLTGFSKIQGMYLGAYLFDLDFNISANCLIEHLNHHIDLYKNEHVNQLPLDIYFNHVLDMRINSEQLSCAQPYFYELLKEYLKKDLYETVIELNYWAHAEVHYGPTDGRTRNSIETYQAGIGRCGEQSTFMVDILRSLGIPARQIYVPWWTHSDDRHAWVEVFVNEKWFYLGACEPEPVLNKAWFDHAASLAAIAHTHIFSSIYDNKKLATKTEDQYKSINVTNHYTDTRKVIIYNYLDGVEKFELCVFNYGSLNVLAIQTFDNNISEIEVGQGDLFVRVIKDKSIYLTKVEQDQIIVELSEKTLIKKPYCVSQEMGLHYARQTQTISQDKLNEHILKKELAQRKYERKMLKISADKQTPFQEVSEHIGEQQAKSIFETMSEKDREDIDPEIVITSFMHVKDEIENYPKDIFYQYLVNCRISIETLDNNVKIFEDFNVEGSNNLAKAKAVHKYVEENIIEDTQFSIPYSIRPVRYIYQQKKANDHEKELLKVALLRYLKVPSKIDEIDGTMRYYDRKIKAFSSVKKTYIVKTVTNNETVMIKSSKHLFAEEVKTNTIEISEGLYEISTTKRYPDLSQDIKYVPLYINCDQVIDMRLNSENILDKLSKIPIKQSLITAEIYHGDGIYMILDVNEEPSVHIVTELLNKKAMLNKYRVPLILINKTKDLKHPLVAKISQELEFIKVINHDIVNEDQLIRTVFAEPNEYPFIMYVFEDMCLYKNSGYQVGLIDNDWNKQLFKKFQLKE